MEPSPKRISQLDAAGPLTGAEQLALVQDTRTVRASVDTFRNYTDTSCQCTLTSRYNQVGNSAGGSSFLMSYTMPGGTVSTDGSWIHCRASGYFGSNGDNKYVGFAFRDFNLTNIFGASLTTTTNGYNGNKWELDFKIQRASASTFTSTRKITVIDSVITSPMNSPEFYLDNVHSGTFTNMWANNIYISIWANSATATANNVVADSFIVELHKLDTNS